jgi:chemotaxis protein CheC
MFVKTLCELQLKALCEIGNAGADEAAIALSRLVKHKIQIRALDTQIVPLANKDDWSDQNEKMVALSMKVDGKASGKALFLLSLQGWKYITRNLTRKKKSPDSFNEEIDCPHIEEAGTILIESYLKALKNFSGINPKSSAPVLSSNNLKTMLEGLLEDSKETDNNVFVVATEFLGENTYKGFFLFIPDENALSVLFGVFYRNFVRVECVKDISYQVMGWDNSLGAKLEGQVLNIGGGGFLLQINQQLKPGDEVLIHLPLETEVLQIFCMVKRITQVSPDSREHNISVEFQSISERNRDKVVKHVFDIERDLRKQGLM